MSTSICSGASERSGTVLGHRYVLPLLIFSAQPFFFKLREGVFAQRRGKEALLLNTSDQPHDESAFLLSYITNRTEKKPRLSYRRPCLLYSAGVLGFAPDNLGDLLYMWPSILEQEEYCNCKCEVLPICLRASFVSFHHNPIHVYSEVRPIEFNVFSKVSPKEISGSRFQRNMLRIKL